MPSRLRVLVTSSDPDNSRKLGSILSECGLDPVLTSTLEDSQSLLAKRDISLVFCDAQLADGTFRELLRLTEAARIPVVVASRVHETPQYLEAMRLGAFDFIAPPYRRSEVEHIVASALHRPVAAAAGGAGGFSAATR
jgi:DNA-binding NtrC family response regulator